MKSIYQIIKSAYQSIPEKVKTVAAVTVLVGSAIYGQIKAFNDGKEVGREEGKEIILEYLEMRIPNLYDILINQRRKKDLEKEIQDNFEKRIRPSKSTELRII